MGDVEIFKLKIEGKMKRVGGRDEGNALKSKNKEGN